MSRNSNIDGSSADFNIYRVIVALDMVRQCEAVGIGYSKAALVDLLIECSDDVVAALKQYRKEHDGNA